MLTSPSEGVDVSTFTIDRYIKMSISVLYWGVWVGDLDSKQLNN